MKAWRQIHHERLRALIAALAKALNPPAAAASPGLPAPAPSTTPPAEAAPHESVPPHLHRVQALSQPQPILPEGAEDLPVPAADAGLPIPVHIAPPTPEEGHTPAPTSRRIVPDFPTIDLPLRTLGVREEPDATRLAEPRGSAKAFFTALGWMPVGLGKHPTTPSKLLPTEPQVEIEGAPVGRNDAQAAHPSAAKFFSKLAWDGSSVGPATLVVSVRATRGDAGLDPRTADLGSGNLLLAGMLSAARTSDRLADRVRTPPPNARSFLASLPWNKSANPEM